MGGASLIFQYFPDLSDRQRQQFLTLEKCYHQWNKVINVISRRDIDNLYKHHVLHSLALVKIVSLTQGNNVLDVGSGGGFPGIPLAIYFPHIYFHLIDSIGKKIKVINDVANTLNITNIKATQCRAEQVTDEYDFVMSRAVANINTIYQWTKDIVRPGSTGGILHGMLCFKGGDLHDELMALKKPYTIYPLSTFFEEQFFTTKTVVHVPVL